MTTRHQHLFKPKAAPISQPKGDLPQNLLKNMHKNIESKGIISIAKGNGNPW